LRARGFIDLHTHGLGRCDTRTNDPSHILRIAALHEEAGTAAILPTIYPAAVSVMRSHIEAVMLAMQMQKASGREFGARILGVHLEGPFLNPVRCGALDPATFIKPSAAVLHRIIADYENLVRIITLAPEMPGCLSVIRRCREMGIRVNMGHSDATYEQALRGKEAGATGITHIFNAMRPFHHRDPGIAALGLLDEDLYIEVIADGRHLHPAALSLIFSTKRLDRIIVVSDSVRGGGGGRPVFTGGGKKLAGSGITLSGSFPVLRQCGVPDAEIEEAAADNPARYLGLPS